MGEFGLKRKREGIDTIPPRSFASSDFPSAMAKRSNDIPIKLEKIRPKPGQLRRYSTSNSTIQLSEPAMNTPIKLEKTKPKPGSVRRYSTGNSLIQTSESSPNAIPIYLRSSSISSCHDFCKYGRKHDSQTNLKPPRITTKRNDQNAVKKEKLSLPDKNYRGKRADLDSAFTESKPKPKPKSKPFAANHESSHQLTSAKQPKKPFLKSSNTIRINQNDVRKDKVGRQAKNFLPNSIKVPTAKSSPRKVSDSKIKNCVKKPEIDKTSINVENEKVPSEKIIHVIEPTKDDENPKECTEEENSVEIENGDNNGDHHMVKESVSDEDITNNDGEEVEIENGDNINGDPMVKDSISDEEIMVHNKNEGEVVEIENGDNNGDPMVKDSVFDEDITNHNENDGEVVEIENGDNNGDPMAKDSVSEEEIKTHDKNVDDPCEIVLQHQAEETKSLSLIEEAKRKLIQIRKNKVMDLVAAFEKLIKNPDQSKSITSVFTF